MTSSAYILATEIATVTFRPLDADRVHVTTQVRDAARREYRIHRTIMATAQARKYYNRLLLNGFYKW